METREKEKASAFCKPQMTVFYNTGMTIFLQNEKTVFCETEITSTPTGFCETQYYTTNLCKKVFCEKSTSSFPDKVSEDSDC